MGLIDVERAIVCVCFKAEVPQEQLAALGDRRTFMLYREMVRDRLRRELHVALPRTRKLVGDAALERAFVQHLDRNPPRTRFFREVVLEFARDAAPMFRADRELAAWSGDLVTYEAALWEVADLDDRVASGQAGPREFAFDRPPWLSPALRLLSLSHAVQALRGTATECAARPTFLCVHRAPSRTKAKAWTLNATTHRLMQMWLEDASLTVTQAVHRLAAERDIVADSRFVDALCGVLAEFLERGVVLGSR